jgi:DNA modification methylase
LTFLPIDEVKPFGGNPRIGDVGLIAESLQANGQYRPIVVREGTYEILAGNHTWQAAKSLGWEKIWVALVDVDDETARRIVLVDNRANDVATYDEQALAELLASLDDLVGSGYSAEDVDTLLASLETSGEPTALTDPDDVPEPPATPQSRLGDVWSLGPHRLLVGDATQDLSALMQGEDAHLVWTDPPWNVNYGDQKEGNIQNYKPRKILNDNLGEMFGEFCDGFSARLKEYSRPGAPIYLVMSAQEWPVIHASLSSAGFHWSSTIIWAKDHLVLSRKDYHTQYEPIWYGWNDSAGRLNPVVDRKQSDLWQIDRPVRSDLHPTTKPVELVARSIRNSSQTGDIVLDPFGGSGSTLIACHSTGRIARLVELDPKYADVILRRYMEHTGDTPTNQDGHRFGHPENQATL